MGILALLLLGLTAAATLSGQKLELKRTVLANGMTVIVHEDHDIPNVAMQSFYKVGGRNEHPGTTGLSHFFEHMMFNGAKKYGPKQFDIQMENNGGHNNGYTNRDITSYQDWFPAAALELMFDMEADRIRDLAFDPKIIESERGVVYSERRLSVDNSPIGALDEQLWAIAFVAHPYHGTVIGWPSDIESWTMDDLKKHWSMGYAPNNCVLVVAGDVTEAQVLTLAKKYLEPIPRKDPPLPVKTKEPEQRGERRLILEKQTQLPILMLGYHIPETSNPATPTLELLNSIFVEGRSSRLHQRLVEKDQLALTVSGSVNEGLDPTLWDFSARPRVGVDPAKVEAVLTEELELVAKNGVTADELNKAKTQFLVGFYRSAKTIAGKANLIGQFEIFHGGAEKLPDWPDVVDKVTVEDIQKAAAKYLRRQNRTVATLIPEKTPEKKESAQ
jgi:zinc protease